MDIGLKDRRGRVRRCWPPSHGGSGGRGAAAAGLGEGGALPLEGQVDGAGQSPLHLAVASMRWSLATSTIVLDADMRASTPARRKATRCCDIVVRTGCVDAVALLMRSAAPM